MVTMSKNGANNTTSVPNTGSSSLRRLRSSQNRTSNTSLSNASWSSTTSSILLAIILAVTNLVSPCEGRGEGGGPHRLPDDAPFMDYGGVAVRPTPRLKVLQQIPQLDDPSTRYLQISSNFDHLEPYVPLLYKPWWSPVPDQQNPKTPEENERSFLPYFKESGQLMRKSLESDGNTQSEYDESGSTERKYYDEPRNTVSKYLKYAGNNIRKYLESDDNSVRKYDEYGGTNTGRKAGNVGRDHSMLNNRPIFDSPYRGRAGVGGGRFNPFMQQPPDNQPSSSSDTDDDQESELEAAEVQPHSIDDSPDSLEPYFEPQTSITMQCYICNQSSSLSSHHDINNNYCNLQRGLLSSCGRGFNICLQYCDTHSGTTERACGRTHRKRNDLNCRVLRETIPTLAHCSECSHSACNTGMNCRLDAPYHVSLPTNPPPLPVKQLTPSLTRWKTHNQRLQPRGIKVMHNESEDSVVMIGTDRRSSTRELTNKDKPPPNVQEENNGSISQQDSTTARSTIQDFTQNSDDPLNGSSSTPMTVGSSNPVSTTSGSATETPPTSSSAGNLDLSTEHGPGSINSSSSRPIELEYAEYTPEANQKLIDQHKFVYFPRSVSHQEKGTMLMCLYAAAATLIRN